MKFLFTVGILFAGFLFSAFSQQRVENCQIKSASLEVADDSFFDYVSQPKAARVAEQIDDTELTYGEWEFIAETSWQQGVWDGVFKPYFGDEGENLFSVYSRKCIENPNLVQIKLSKVFNGVDFIIDGDLSTNVCTSARQKTGYSTARQEDATIDYYDIGIMDSKYLGSSTFSLAGGSILIRGLAFYYREDSNTPFTYLPTLILNFGQRPEIDYDVDVKPVYGKNEKQAKISLTCRGDVKQFKYYVSHNEPARNYEVMLVDRPDEIKTATDEIIVDLAPGYFNLVVRPCNENGEWLGQETDEIYIWDNRQYSFYSNADDDAEWVDFGEGMMSESLLSSRFNTMGLALPENAGNKYPCKLLTRKDAYGKIVRVVNPFGEGHPLYEASVGSNRVRFDYPDEDFYLDVNMEDPEHVYVYYRPLGPVTSSSYISYNTWEALGTSDYLAYYLLQSGNPVEEIISGMGRYRWNKIQFETYNLEIVLNQKLSLPNGTVDENVCLWVEGTDDVASIKYAFVNDEDGMTTADGILSGDIASFTATADKSASGVNRFKINLPDGDENCMRLVAVAYGADGECLDSYLDEEIDAWHPIGDATITGLNNFFKETAPAYRWGWSGRYRLNNPGALDGSGPYFYINATDPGNVNFAGDWTTGYFTTGYFMDGYSTNVSAQLNTICNVVASGLLSPRDYELGVMDESGLINIDDTVFCIIVYNTDDRPASAYYMWGGTIQLPAGALTAGVDSVVEDRVDEAAPVEYYNLQGVKVNNPSRGIYIRRQGSTVDKILIK